MTAKKWRDQVVFNSHAGGSRRSDLNLAGQRKFRDRSGSGRLFVWHFVILLCDTLLH